MSDLFDRILLLKKSSVFSEVLTEDLRIIAQALEKEIYLKGDHVFDINEQGDFMYILITGRVGISTHENTKVTEYLTVLGPGDCFGEMNLLDDQPRSATAHVLEDSHMLSLEKGKLRGLIINYPEISLGMLKSLSLRLRHTTQQIREREKK